MKKYKAEFVTPFYVDEAGEHITLSKKTLISKALFTLGGILLGTSLNMLFNTVQLGQTNVVNIFLMVVFAIVGTSLIIYYGARA
jgi:hypothetical protein